MFFFVFFFGKIPQIGKKLRLFVEESEILRLISSPSGSRPILIGGRSTMIRCSGNSFDNNPGQQKLSDNNRINKNSSDSSDILFD